MKSPVQFLCIGAQRSGTSWLAWNLRQSPDFWIPPCKEVHYFTRSPRYPSPSHLSCDGIARKFLGRSQEAKTWRWLFFGYAHKWIARVSPRERPKQLLWVLRYFFGRPSDEWYLDLFRDGAGKICGEITPDYSLLDEEGVEDVVRLLPRIKVLFLMRDPLERALSQMRYHMDGRVHPNLSRASDDELVGFATEPGQLLRGDHDRILGIWQTFLPAENIYLGYYEDIKHRPGEMLDDIFGFLGAKKTMSAKRDWIREKRNASTPRCISAEATRAIARAHADIVRRCAERFGGHAAGWASRLEHILARGN